MHDARLFRHSLWRRGVPVGVFVTLLAAPIPAALSGCGGTQSWLGSSPMSPELTPTESPAFGVIASGQDADRQNRIVFTGASPTDGNATRTDGNDEIFTTDEFGQNILRYTATNAADREPAWNPDHTRIVYIRSRQQGRNSGAFIQDPEDAEHTDIFVIGADGASVALPGKLTPAQQQTSEERQKALETTKTQPLWKADDFVDGDHKGVRVDYPRYSPDGLSLVVAVIMDDGTSRLFVADAEGRGSPRKLVGYGGPATWRPDGRQIVFSARKPDDVKTRLFVVRVGAGDVAPLTDPPMVTADDITAVVPASSGGTPISTEAFPTYFADTLPMFDPTGATVVFSRAATTTYISATRSTRLPRLLRVKVAAPADDLSGLVGLVKGEDKKPLPPEALTQESAGLTNDQTREDAAAAFSPDGSRLLFTRRATPTASGGRLVILDLATHTEQSISLVVDNKTIVVGAAAWR